MELPLELERAVLAPLLGEFAPVFLLVCRRWAQAGEPEMRKMKRHPLGFGRARGAALAEWAGRAGGRGHLGLMRWACSEAQFSASALSCAVFGAALEGSVGALAALRDLGAPLRARACAAAASNGHLGALHWLRRQGCAWDASVTELAACGGHRLVYVWAVRTGCPTDGTNEAILGAILAARRRGP